MGGMMVGKVTMMTIRSVMTVHSERQVVHKLAEGLVVPVEASSSSLTENLFLVFSCALLSPCLLPFSCPPLSVTVISTSFASPLTQLTSDHFLSVLS